MKERLTVFLTGATGLLGINTVEALLKRGYHVLALARNAEKAAKVLPSAPRVQIVVGDLSNAEAWIPRLAEADVLIHGAAYFWESFHRGDHADLLKAYNVDLPVRLVEAAASFGLQRSIVVSSSGVYSGRPDGKASAEDAPAEGQLPDSGYQQSKVAMDRALAKLTLPDSHRLVIVRPGWMFGPNDVNPTGAGQVILDMQKMRWYQFVKGTPFGIVDARDVAEGIARLVEHPEPSPIYNLAGHNMTAWDALSMIEKIDGTVRMQAVPMRMALTMSSILEFVTGIFRQRNPIPREGLLVVVKGIPVDSSRAERELGLRFRPFEETARDSLAFINRHFHGRS